MSNLKDIILRDLFVTLPEDGDARVKDWPLMTSIVPTFFIVLLYVLFIIFGEQWMKTRKAFDLRQFMFAYNFIQVIVCTYITYESGYVWFKQGYSLLCQPVDFSESPMGMKSSISKYILFILSLDLIVNRMDDTKQACAASWLFYIMKLVDLIDTIIFILRKKNNQITFLHVYHHITMTFCSWYAAKYIAGGQTLFVGIINSFIHIIMYSYYGLSACGPKIQKYLWWKRYITQAQMIQFVAVIIHSIINLQKPCNYPKIFDLAFLIYGITILMLFANFYLQSYIVKQERSRKERQSK